MRNTSHLDSETPEHLLREPAICAECGLPVSARQIADSCDLCGAPRCRSCASLAGEQASDSQQGGYICSSCAAEE